MMVTPSIPPIYRDIGSLYTICQGSSSVPVFGSCLDHLGSYYWSISQYHNHCLFCGSVSGLESICYGGLRSFYCHWYLEGWFMKDWIGVLLFCSGFIDWIMGWIRIIVHGIDGSIGSVHKI